MMSGTGASWPLQCVSASDHAYGQPAPSGSYVCRRNLKVAAASEDLDLVDRCTRSRSLSEAREARRDAVTGPERRAVRINWVTGAEVAVLGSLHDDANLSIVGADDSCLDVRIV
jgi:hypothetical protein